MADEDLTNCPVCFEDYGDSGDHIPRILPCHHTLCATCVGQVIRKRALVCPECRIKHAAANGITTFPQNKYIVGNLNRKPVEVVVEKPKEKPKKKKRRFPKCTEHMKEAGLYCYNVECQKAICQSCLIKQHKTHDVVDIVEEIKEKSEALAVNVDKVAEVLEAKKGKMLVGKKELKKKTKACLEKIKAQKEEHLKIIEERYDELLKDVQDDMKKNNSDIEDEVTTMNKHVEVLNNIKGKIDPSEATREDLMQGFQTVRSIAGNATLNLTDTKVHRYPEYREGSATVDEIRKSCGQLIPHMQYIDPSDPGDKAVKSISGGGGAGGAGGGAGDKPILTRVVQRIFYGDAARKTSRDHVNCQVSKSFVTKFSVVHHMSVLDGDCAVVCGRVNDEYKLIQYNLESGGESKSSTLKILPSGMTTVKLDGTSYVAFSDKFENTLELRDKKNHIVRVYSAEQPSSMTSSQTSCILYVDVSKTPREIAWLDCSTSPPKQCRVTHTRLCTIRDLCLIQPADDQLVVVTCDEKGIKAYNSNTDKLEWSAKGLLPGFDKPLDAFALATDGRGHLFVSDNHNSCIQMFSVDGVHSGCLLKEGEQGLGKPYNICWSDSLSSLIVAHEKSSQYCISVIKMIR